MNWTLRNPDGSTLNLTSDQLIAMAKSGRLAPTDWVCRDGLPDFVQAGRVKGLFPAQPELAAAAPPPNPRSAGQYKGAPQTTAPLENDTSPPHKWALLHTPWVYRATLAVSIGFIFCPWITSFSSSAVATTSVTRYGHTIDPGTVAMLVGLFVAVPLSFLIRFIPTRPAKIALAALSPAFFIGCWIYAFSQFKKFGLMGELNVDSSALTLHTNVTLWYWAFLAGSAALLALGFTTHWNGPVIRQATASADPSTATPMTKAGAMPGQLEQAPMKPWLQMLAWAAWDCSPPC